jgi:hypothetical protein
MSSKPKKIFIPGTPHLTTSRLVFDYLHMTANSRAHRTV